MQSPVGFGQVETGFGQAVRVVDPADDLPPPPLGQEARLCLGVLRGLAGFDRGLGHQAASSKWKEFIRDAASTAPRTALSIAVATQAMETAMAEDSELEENGMAVLRPVIGWEVGQIEDMVMILRLEYREQAPQGPVEHLSPRYVLTPELALQLAATLYTNAQRILSQLPPARSV